MRNKVKKLVDKYGVDGLKDKLHVGRSIIYYWMNDQKKPGYHVGKEIDRMFKRLKK